MSRMVPGTTLKFTEQARNSAFSLISPVLEATGGLTLSQLTKLTGLEGSTIQNWVKRGWVPSAKGKKYYDRQILRTLIINILRGVMKLDDIVKLMSYVNGDVDDTSDDIIEEEALYNLLCRIIFAAEDNRAFETEALKKLIECEIEASDCICSDADKLKKAMFVMITAYRSAFLKKQMEDALKEIMRG